MVVDRRLDSSDLNIYLYCKKISAVNWKSDDLDQSQRPAITAENPIP
jgi:hypothetical protein